jgi:hypothetical protein
MTRIVVSAQQTKPAKESIPNATASARHFILNPSFLASTQAEYSPVIFELSNLIRITPAQHMPPNPPEGSSVRFDPYP